MIFYRTPAVAIQRTTGQIEVTKCSSNCKANQGGRCSHVAALLYCIKDIKYQREPIIFLPPTSKSQIWGKGDPKASNPQPIGAENVYKRKRFSDIQKWDPRPEKFQKESKEQIDRDFNNLITHLQKHTLYLNEPLPNFLKALKVKYDDYELSEEEKTNLKMNMDYHDKNMRDLMDQYRTDELSNEFCLHLADTIEQSKDKDSEWLKAKRYVIGASGCKEFATNPKVFIKKFWNMEPNISEREALKWGNDHEFQALRDFEKRAGTFVDPCGLFISKLYPFLGCSPDSISRDRSFLVEVKCPHSLKDTVPWDFSKLENKSAHFNEIIGYDKSGNAILQLKRSHKYYCQVNMQMFVTGIHETKFVT